MALAETVLRKVHKLGLIPKIIRLLPVISLVLAISSVSWLASLPLQGNYRNVYISENALMPSQVTSYFRESEWNIVRGYRTEIRKFDFDRIEENNVILGNWLTDIGLEPMYHKNKFGEDTLYTILHAPRGDDTESMVLTVPWFTSKHESNIGGISLGISLARYFNRMSIWSKNIIFVFPQDGHASLRSWVEAYHTTLDETAGSIEAALVMEYASESDHFKHYSISYEGLNGQLPNLDLINTVNDIGYHENLHCSIQKSVHQNDYSSRLKTLVKGIIQLTLAGLSKRNTAGCEAFSGWQIQAITITAHGDEGNADITQFGRIVDSTLRSVNNLLEKFHQSFFFYLLLSSKHFVSIGTYLPSAIMMAVAFAISSLGCFLNGAREMNEYISKITKILLIFTIIEVGCLITSIILPMVVKYTESSIQMILGLSTIIALIISMIPILPFNLKKLDKTTSYGLIGVSLFFISMLITTLLIVHFSLAMSIGLIALPLTFIQPLINNTSQSIMKNKLKIVVSLIISNPLFIIYLTGLWYMEDGSVIELMRGLLTSWDELQCWTWFVIILGWLPTWIGVAFAASFGNFVLVPQEKKDQ